VRHATGVLIAAVGLWGLACTVKPPSPSQLASLRSAERVRVLCRQSYVDAEGLELPLAALAGRIFGLYAGARAVDAGATDFDATLRVEAKVCSKARLKEIYQQVADEIMAEIAKLQPHEDKTRFP